LLDGVFALLERRRILVGLGLREGAFLREPGERDELRERGEREPGERDCEELRERGERDRECGDRECGDRERGERERGERDRERGVDFCTDFTMATLIRVRKSFTRPSVGKFRAFNHAIKTGFVAFDGGATKGDFRGVLFGEEGEGVFPRSDGVFFFAGDGVRRLYLETSTRSSSVFMPLYGGIIKPDFLYSARVFFNSVADAILYFSNISFLHFYVIFFLFLKIFFSKISHKNI